MFKLAIFSAAMANFLVGNLIVGAVCLAAGTVLWVVDLCKGDKDEE